MLLFAVLVAARAAGWIPYYKTFYIPAEAMAPTLLKDDHILAVMGTRQPLRRGDIVLFRAGAETYIKRIAGLPQDRIGMVAGRVILNGRAIPQQRVGSETIAGPEGPLRAVRLRERFPGEAEPHEIYDQGPSPTDDVPEQRVAAGHLFVLGDNRDMSADSRVAKTDGGVEQLPIADVTGRPLVYTWGSSRKFWKPVH
jgi:signal peptidase I